MLYEGRELIVERSYLELEEVHSAELGMLKAFDEFCAAHGLRYSLFYGTLIGAVRHKGFIPWDDDVDVAMPTRLRKAALRERSVAV